jgi:ABC-type transport system involved in multi-copper enzyme maturation permease subunit
MTCGEKREEQNMIWKIAKKEFLLNLMTFKFAVGTILCVILMFVFVPILAKDYQHRLKEYNENVAANEAELRKVMVYKNIIPTVYRPPNVLSVFSEGVEKRLGTSARISHSDVPEISATSDETNPYMSMFPALDVSLVLRVVFSALALLVAYNVISGEREQGTLKLILSGTLPRSQLLLGKLLAGLMILFVPVTIVFILGLMFLLYFPMIELTASNWAGIGLMYIASLIFISAMYNLGLFFSALMKKSAISLVLGLFAWVIFVAVIPSGSIYLATQIRPLEPEEKLEVQRVLAMEEYRGKYRKVSGKYPNWRGPKSDAKGAFGKGYIVVCAESCLHDASKVYPLLKSLESNYGDSIWRVELSRIDSLLRQNHLAGNIARISPLSVYENAMSTLAQSDFRSFQSFMDYARAYRNQISEYIGSQTDGFSSLSYFTTCSWQDAGGYDKKYEEYIQTVKQMLNESERKKVFAVWGQYIDEIKKGRATLDLNDFPRFTYRSSIAKSLRRAIPDLATLAFVNVLLFALSFLAFMRYDVRSD